jgi:hypothetical protein
LFSPHQPQVELGIVRLGVATEAALADAFATVDAILRPRPDAPGAGRDGLRPASCSSAPATTRRSGR